MKALVGLWALLACFFLSTGLAAAVDDLFKTGSTTVTVGNNDITVTNNFKYVNFLGPTLNVTLTFAGECGVSFVSLGPRVPKGFTPRGVTGTVANVDGTTTPGTVTFDLTFNTLKTAGRSKMFGMAHIDLNLAVDDDCTDTDTTEDVPLKVGVQVSASTASHP